MSEPKKCPFCGSKAEIHESSALGEVIKFVYCPNENCHFHHRTASVSDWNTRPIEDALNKRIAELQKDNDDFCSQLSDYEHKMIELFDLALDYENSAERAESERDEARAMIEQLIEAIESGCYIQLSPELEVEKIQEWYAKMEAIIAEWKEMQK